VLERVCPRVLEGGVEQRAEVADPHHRGERDPGDGGMRHDRDGPRVQQAQHPRAPRPGPERSQDERDRGPGYQQRCRHHREQQVLDHVHREEGVGIDVDRRQERRRERHATA
jgi:hypothetical protein